MELATPVIVETEPLGLDFWMARVLQECDRTRRGFSPDAIHDLRVALRRCRSIADGYMTLDSHPAWKQMKNEGKRLFQQLGELRDTQVMMEWVQRLASANDKASVILGSYLADREDRLKQSALEAVRAFNLKKWASWIRLLSGRARHIPPESDVFRHIALECWTEAHALHRRALRNRSHASYHRLRIGLKKFRYTVENFLPSLHALWGAELRELQDLLGELHDLHVLWQTALAIKALPEEIQRSRWRKRISEEIDPRIETYREKMLGKESLELVWRSKLPDSNQVLAAALARLQAWASFRDPNPAHSAQVAKLALQIYDGLDSLSWLPASRPADSRRTLEAAALLRDVGMHEMHKKHQRASYRLIRKLNPPIGWNAEAMRHVALIARFHRGALPRPGQKEFSGISEEHIKAILLLCGILRLANAFDFRHPGRIRRLKLTRTGDTLRIAGSGYSENDAQGEKLAAARHLIEAACRHPILIE